MEKEKINQILISYKDYIPNDKVAYLKSVLEKTSDDAFENILSAKTYNPTTTLILSILLGTLGIDRFYIRDIGLGICKLLFGFLTFGIWPLIDIFFSFKKAKAKNLENLLSLIS